MTGCYLTDEGCKSSDKGESPEARGEEVQAAHLYYGGGRDGAPGGEEGAEHDGDDHEGPDWLKLLILGSDWSVLVLTSTPRRMAWPGGRSRRYLAR